MQVALFVTCLVDAVRPEIGFSAIKLLERAGCDVVVPPAQTCCGQPAYNAGDSATARTLAEKVLRELDNYEYIVVPSGSCGGQIRHHYPRLFADHPDLKVLAERVSSRTWELTDFLANVVGVERVDSNFAASITYHDSCSGLRELGVKVQPRSLLAKVSGVELTEMKDCEQCCGFGGTFAVKYGDISGTIADEKCRNIQASGAKAVVMGDLGCMLNIEGRLRRIGDRSTRVLHVAQVLAGDA